MKTGKEFDEFINHLKEESKDKIVLVEGKKDKSALERLGIGNIKILDKPLYKITEELVKAEKEVILLIDLDKEGKLIYHKLIPQLKKFGVKVNEMFRNKLFKTKLRQIEGIDKFFRKMSFNF